MIRSFACQDTEALSLGTRVKRWVNIERAALRKLEQLHVSVRLEDLRVPPGNRLEMLKGNRADQ
jgi:proteic killer suppression protein